jgi:hypothetical protein
MVQAWAWLSKRVSAPWVALAVVGAWLTHPVLTPSHVEGFSASIVSLALHINTGHIADYDRLHPANLEYFTLSRLGIVSWMSFLTGTLGISGDLAMRITTWLGFATLASSSFVLVRRWAQASNLATAVALLLIPGLVESSFFYNDTIFAAALGVTALAVIGASSGAVGAAASGVLFGAAIVARVDAILLAPAVALIGYEQHGLGRQFWSRAVVFTMFLLGPVVLVPAALDTTILDIVTVTKSAIGLWGRGFRPAQHAREASFFIGIPAAILVGLGCLALARRRDSSRLLLLVGVPALFNLVALGKIWQARQLLPLTPFLAALLALGWRHVSSESAGRDGAALKRTVIVIACLVWVAPLIVVRVSDGPRAPYGRLWSPVLWTRWQRASNVNQAELRALVDTPARDSTVFITDTWDADRYLHLALQERGYRYVETSDASDACSKTAEKFVKGDRRALHIRLHQPFLPNWRALAASRLETWAIPCVASWRAERVVLVSPLEQFEWTVSDSVTSDLAGARVRALQQIAEARYSPQLPIEVRATALPSLRDAYLRQAAHADSLSYGRQVPAMPLNEAERLMAARVWQPARDTP